MNKHTEHILNTLSYPSSGISLTQGYADSPCKRKRDSMKAYSHSEDVWKYQAKVESQPHWSN